MPAEVVELFAQWIETMRPTFGVELAAQVMTRLQGAYAIGVARTSIGAKPPYDEQRSAAPLPFEPDPPAEPSRTLEEAHAFAAQLREAVGGSSRGLLGRAAVEVQNLATCWWEAENRVREFMLRAQRYEQEIAHLREQRSAGPRPNKGQR